METTWGRLKKYVDRDNEQVETVWNHKSKSVNIFFNHPVVYLCHKKSNNI